MEKKAVRWCVVQFCCAVMVLFIVSPAYSAKYANPALLVTPDEVAQHAKEWLVLDCRAQTATTDKKSGAVLKGYDDGHIPGAISLGGDCADILREKESKTVFKDAKTYEQLLGGAGISNGKTVVIYGDTPRITNATVGFWVMEYLGHRDVRFLNGGIEAWEAAGKPLATQATRLPAAKYVVQVQARRLATSDEVLQIAKGSGKGSQIVDSRTAAEYRGEDVRAKRGGRIPMCALNVSHVDLYDKNSGKIKSMDELEKIYGGLDKKKRVIPYCQTGTRSTLSYLVFRLMGFKDPANYDDSWIIWGNDETRFPVEK